MHRAVAGAVAEALASVAEKVERLALPQAEDGAGSPTGPGSRSPSGPTMARAA